MAWPGSIEQGRGMRGLPRNLGDPKCSTGEKWHRGGHQRGSENILAGVDPFPRERPWRDEEREGQVVLPNEGNEVREDGIRES